MARTKRLAQFIQRLAYESLFPHDESDVRPDDVLSGTPASNPGFENWSATSFAAYVPYRSPPNN